MGHPREARNLKLSHFSFQLATGLVINMNKTKAYNGTDANRKYELAKTLGCQMGSLPMNYLGIPIPNKGLPRSMWQGLIGKSIKDWMAGRTYVYPKGGV